ncbi:MAG: hypothetical protein ACLQVJ_27305 [Syntrophobacteraceae bacterium]
MKKTIIILLVLIFGAAALLYAQTGNLIVNGQVGVGVNPPRHAVDVQGDVNVTGNFMINGVIQTGPTLTGALSGLLVTNDATYPNTQIDVTANFIGTVVPSGTMGINCTTSGQAAGNDLDTGSLTANTWYHIWVIFNGTTIAGLASTSGTSPAMPGNYANASKRLVGMAVTNSSSQFAAFHQYGNQTFFNVKQAISLTVSSRYVPLSLTSYIPPNAATALIYCSPAGTGTFDASNDGTNLWISSGWTGDGIVASESTIPILTAQTIWYTVTTSSTLYIEGFMLNL